MTTLEMSYRTFLAAVDPESAAIAGVCGAPMKAIVNSNASSAQLTAPCGDCFMIAPTFLRGACMLPGCRALVSACDET